jgi:hypothetical protein
MPSNGLSTELAPIQVRIAVTEIRSHIFLFLVGLNLAGFVFVVIKMARIMIENARAMTPPSFEGMERRMTYANRKYHSGWMWMGAIRGFAMLKFSTSPRMFGVRERMVRSVAEIVMAGRVSFIMNRGLNFILSLLGRVLDGFEDPFSWRKIKCIRTITVMIIGIRKWSEKNRVRVGWEMEGPPQIQVTRSFPIRGIAESTPVITVAPQKDICPQGKT